jgi:UDP-GlcNAc:undecaprenyl-phosphate GlcNAc-1-phosphate transferase
MKYANRLRLIDNPVGSSRKLHKKPMPRSGGLGIIIPTAMAILIVLPWDDSVFSFLIGSLIIISFGLLDDITELNPAQKLIGQALGVTLAMAGGMVIVDVPFLTSYPAWVSYILTFGFVMAVINGVNFSDGMDGLAAGTALMALVVIFLLALDADNDQVAIIAVTICAALVGFLRFNTHPATIFMGDAGSQFLGFSVAWLAITLSQSATPELTTLLPLLILGIPIMDVLQVIPVRIKKKLPLPGPDKEHFHHQISTLGFPQQGVVAIVYLLQLVLLSGAYALRHGPDILVLCFYTCYLILVLGLLYFAHAKGWRLEATNFFGRFDARNHIFRRASALHPYSGKFYGLAVAVLLSVFALMSTDIPEGLIYIALILAVVLSCFKLIARGRRRMLIGRLSTYTATSFCVYGMSLSTNADASIWGFNILLLVLAVMLAISIRTTRKEYFWLTPQDLLVLFFVILLAPKLSLELGQGVNPNALVLNTIVLLYTCEYVLARGAEAQNRLTIAAIFSLFIFAVHL